MKKIISVILCSLMLLTSVLSVSANAELVPDDTFSLGDANGDGKFNAMDSLLIKASMVEVTKYDVNLQACDLDASGSTTPKDSYFVKLCLAGMKDISDFDNPNQVHFFTIGGNPISDYYISVPADTDMDNDNIYYAATELRDYVYQATGVELSISLEDKWSEKTIRFHDITIDSEEAAALDIGIEDYIYKVEDNDLHIYGSLRGNMYAVYEILEDYLGFRFYSADKTFLYKSRRVDIPEGIYVHHKTQLDFRFARQTFNSNHEEYYFPRRLNGSQTYNTADTKHGTLTGPHFINAHSFGYYWRMGTGTMPDESYGTLSKRYSEKYNSGIQVDELSWQPCATSTSHYDTLFQGLLDTMGYIQTWGHVFRGYEEYYTSCMSFSICYNQNYCACRNCRKGAVTQGDGYSGLYLRHVNRAAADIQYYYPGMKLYTIIFDYTVPKTTLPDDNVVIMYCGHGCNNHILGSGECGSNTTPLIGTNNAVNEVSMPAWAELCRSTGAEIWYWSYPVTYMTYLTGSPNILDIYYNFDYIINECGFTGIYYEGGGETYNFESLKAYLASKFMWDPQMTYEEFTEIMKEYLYMYYGDGYEYIYEYILMQNEAGDLRGCFINNCDFPGDMYSYEYLAENYEYMRSLITSAIDVAERADNLKHLEYLLICCDFMGLSCVYNDWYVNGSHESIALYEQRYTDMYQSIVNNEMRIGSFSEIPDRIDFSVNPLIQFYGQAAHNPDYQYIP